MREEPIGEPIAASELHHLRERLDRIGHPPEPEGGQAEVLPAPLETRKLGDSGPVARGGLFEHPLLEAEVREREVQDGARLRRDDRGEHLGRLGDVRTHERQHLLHLDALIGRETRLELGQRFVASEEPLLNSGSFQRSATPRSSEGRGRSRDRAACACAGWNCTGAGAEGVVAGGACAAGLECVSGSSGRWTRGRQGRSTGTGHGLRSQLTEKRRGARILQDTFCPS